MLEDAETPKPVKLDEVEAETNGDAAVAAEEATGLNAGVFRANPVTPVLAEVAACVEALVVVVTVENNGELVVPKLGFGADVAENAGAEAGV